MTDANTTVRLDWPELDAVTVVAPVSRVVVLEDRAQVTRRVEVELSPGAVRLAACPVTPLCADRTLRCRVRPVGQLAEPRLRDTLVRRRFLVRGKRPEREQELRAAIDALGDEYRAALAVMLGAGHERALLLTAGKAVGAQINERLAVGAFDDDWPATLTRLRDERARLEAELFALQGEQEDRARRIADLVRELELALAPLADYQAALIAELEIEAAGRYVIEWEYLVPCAIWRPEYTAELGGRGREAEVRWTSAGTVWQATGEDWHQVQLSFSTERPTLGAELPLLDDDRLRARDKSDEEKKTIEVTSRDEVIATTQSAPAKRESDTPPGLDDGGEARAFVVPNPVDVPSDGRPHRLIFEEWSAPAETEQLCVPEKARYVFLRSLQTNRSPMPLLAGPVALIRDGGFVGRSQIAYVAAQERFALSWGSEDGLIVLRDVERQHEEKGLRKHHHHGFAVRLYLANQSGERQRVTIVERLPVAELDAIEVSIDEKGTTPGFTRNDQGHLTWERDLGPGAEAELRLRFAVVMPQNVQWRG